MGSIISFDINLVLPFTQKEPESSAFTLPLIIFLMVLFAILGAAIYYFFVKRNYRIRILSPAAAAILLILAIFLIQFDPVTSGKGKSYRPNPRGFAKTVGKVGKPVAKISSPAVITALTYFGLEKLYDYYNQEPEIFALAISVVVLFSIALILAIIKLIFLAINLCSTRPIQPPIELNEVRSQITEILNRIDPPRNNDPQNNIYPPLNDPIV